MDVRQEIIPLLGNTVRERQIIIFFIIVIINNHCRLYSDAYVVLLVS